MDKTITFSVASYNVEKTLGETLDSLLIDKVLDDIEVIVVNDGSTDSTLAIANEYLKKYPDTIRIIDKKNGGHGSTINAALKNAAGTFFKVIDGDDWVDKHGLIRLVDDLKKCKSDLVLNDYVMVYEKTRHEDVCHNGIYYDGQIHNIEDLIKNRSIAMHEITIRTDILRNNAPEITENCFYVDTEYMQYCVGFSDTVVEYAYPVYRYRIGAQGQSVSRHNRFKRLDDQKTVLFHLLDWYTNNKQKFTPGKAIFIKKDLSRLIQYIIESYCFDPDRDYRKDKAALRALFSDLDKKYPLFDFDIKEIAFSAWDSSSKMSKMQKLYEYMMLRNGFAGFSLFANMQVLKEKKFEKR